MHSANRLSGEYVYSTLERTSSTFSQRSLFRSSSEGSNLWPSERRSSIVDDNADGPASAKVSLTKSLLASHPAEYKEATETSFLRLAGSGKITKLTLSRWLSQDRLYAETYISFITSLIARVNLPYTYVSDKSRSLRWRIVNMLTRALQNIHRELDFFTTTAEKYDLRLDQPAQDGEKQPFLPEEATNQYMELFRSFHDDTTLPLIEGMVVLWATEQCYLTAWTYASQFTSDASSASPEDDADGGALRQEFIPNWSSDEFVNFVDEIAELTDLLADREQANKKLEVYKAVWLHVLDIEKQFWPHVEERVNG